MPLEYADFVHYYEGQPLNEARCRAYFDAFADLMECITRLFWREDGEANKLGITLDDDTLTAAGGVASTSPITISFNGAAAQGAAGKKEP